MQSLTQREKQLAVEGSEVYSGRSEQPSTRIITLHVQVDMEQCVQRNSLTHSLHRITQGLKGKSMKSVYFHQAGEEIHRAFVLSFVPTFRL